MGRHLLLCQRVVGMALQAGIDHAAHLRVRLQEPGHLQGAAGVLLHAQRQGDRAAQDQPGVEGA